MASTKRKIPLAVLALVAIACGPGAKAVPQPIHPSLVNGEFAPLDSGWTRDARDFAGSGAVQALPDGGLTVTKRMNGWNRLSQSVALPDRNVTFRTRARFSAQSSNPGYHAFSSVVLSYLGADGAELGETRWHLLAGSRGWQDSGTRHLIPVGNTGAWTDLDLNITDELRTHLPGLKPASVRALRITLEAFASGTSSC